MIRAATISDIEAIHLLGSTVPEFSVSDHTITFWPPEVLVSAIKANDCVILVAEENEQLIGFIATTFNSGFKKATIENIHVAKEWQGKGVAKALLAELISALQAKGCQYVATLVSPEAEAAMSVYEDAGFARGHQFVWLDKAMSSAFQAVS